MTNKFITFLFTFLSCTCIAQTFTGKVFDAKTEQPLASVSVYFDNTTIGTTTNDNGEFSIDYTDAIQSTLVISFLGYESVFIADYRTKNDVLVNLNEEISQLDTVVITDDDGMSRELKMRRFKNEFLGKSENGKSCKILNEKDIKLRYNKTDRTITAWSKKPIVVLNKNLKYQISFDLIDFEMKLGNWNTSSVIYTGTSFYKDLNKKSKKRILKARDKSYKGSIQHFMRALFNENLKDEGYIFGKKGYKVDPYKFITVSGLLEGGSKTVTLKEKIDIFYKDILQSVMRTTVTEFEIDKFGNYAPISDVLFGGAMGKQRLGDALPMDYSLDNN